MQLPRQPPPLFILQLDQSAGERTQGSLGLSPLIDDGEVVTELVRGFEKERVGIVGFRRVKFPDAMELPTGSNRECEPRFETRRGGLGLAREVWLGMYV